MYVCTYVFFPLLEIQQKESVPVDASAQSHSRWPLQHCSQLPLQSTLFSDFHATTYILCWNILVSHLSLYNFVFLVFVCLCLVFLFGFLRQGFFCVDCPGSHYTDKPGLAIRGCPASAEIKGTQHHTWARFPPRYFPGCAWMCSKPKGLLSFQRLENTLPRARLMLLQRLRRPRVWP